MALHECATGCRVTDRLELSALTAEFLDLCSRTAHFPSKTSVGGSMSLLKASAVLAKPRWASAPL
jgi:hypothetical protein